MIYTLTLNPATDLFIDTDDYLPNKVNRTNFFSAQASGKGINVSLILQELGTENHALGIGGGFSKQFIVDELNRLHIPNTMIDSGKLTRINVFTHVERTGEQYNLVNPGAKIEPEVLEQLILELQKIEKDDLLIVSGSFPEGIDDDFLVDLAQFSQKQHFKLVVDTSSKALLKILALHPYLIKPNDEEVAAFFDVDHPLSLEEKILYGQKLVEMGAETVLLSLGEEGAMLFEKDQIYSANAPRIKPVNTAGAGDTMLATFIHYKEKGETSEVSLKKAVAAGSSTVQTNLLTDFSDVTELEKEIKVRKENTNG